MTTKAKELQLGDAVRLPNMTSGAFNDCTVKQIKDDGYVVLFRPYVQTDDYSHTGGVTCYIGFEQFEVSPETVVTVLTRKGPLR